MRNQVLRSAAPRSRRATKASANRAQADDCRAYLVAYYISAETQLLALFRLVLGAEKAVRPVSGPAHQPRCYIPCTFPRRRCRFLSAFHQAQCRHSFFYGCTVPEVKHA